MDSKSDSPESPIADFYQMAFPSAECGACPLRVGCDLRGTALQCTSIPILEGDIQPGSPDATLWMKQFGHDVALGGQGQFASPRLPQAIPRLTRQKAAGVAAHGLRWVAVTLGEVLLRRQRRILAKSQFIESTGLDPATRVALVMTGEDECMSTLGDEPGALIAAVGAASYDLVLAPAFSVWGRVLGVSQSDTDRLLRPIRDCLRNGRRSDHLSSGVVPPSRHVRPRESGACEPVHQRNVAGLADGIPWEDVGPRAAGVR